MDWKLNGKTSQHTIHKTLSIQIKARILKATKEKTKQITYKIFSNCQSSGFLEQISKG